MDNKKVAIIIVTYNARQYLPECLSSLQKIRYPKEEYSIIVVDNDSRDSTVEFIKKEFPMVYLIENNENLGFAGGNNVGLTYAIQNDFVYAFLLNQDTVVDENFLDASVSAIEGSGNIGAVQSLLLHYKGNDTVNSIGNAIHFLGFAYARGNGKKLSAYALPPVSEIVYPSGAAVLVRLSLLKEIGLFCDELFLYHEDVDLGWRIWLSGNTVVLASQSRVYHKYEFSRSIQKYYFMERNRYIVMFQNYHICTLFFILPFLFVTEIAILLISFFGGFWREKIRAQKYFLKSSSWKKILLSRKKVSLHRRIREREYVRRFSGVIEFQENSGSQMTYIFNVFCQFFWNILRRFIFW